MSSVEPLDAAWLRANPLPRHEGEVDKNSRGRVLVVGGSAEVPGALRLTAEAAFRAGAGKVRMATVAEVAVALGLKVPEAGVVRLPAGEDGHIDAAAAAEPVLAELGRCDAVALGPGMGKPDGVRPLLERVLQEGPVGLPLLLDAAAIRCAAQVLENVPRRPATVLTPHAGEMAALTGEDEEAAAGDPGQAAAGAARRFGATIALKGSVTHIAAPDGRLLRYPGGGVGLATGGSGDVLAGILTALLARGVAPFEATAWAVWLHGEAGRRLAERHGPIGFLARELLPEIPPLMR